MSEKHTPGPWTVRPAPRYEEDRYDSDDFFATVEAASPADPEEFVTIADMPGCEPYASGEGQANARLIAAAPELLEALQGLVDWGVTPEGSVSQEETNRVWLTACAAIAKATEVQP